MKQSSFSQRAYDISTLAIFETDSAKASRVVFTSPLPKGVSTVTFDAGERIAAVKHEVERQAERLGIDIPYEGDRRFTVQGHTWARLDIPANISDATAAAEIADFLARIDMAEAQTHTINVYEFT